MNEIIPLAPLILSLGLLASLICGAWKFRDFVATKSELHEVKEAIERCARKEDLDSLRAAVCLHESQTTHAITELRMDLRGFAEKTDDRWERMMTAISHVKDS